MRKLKVDRSIEFLLNAKIPDLVYYEKFYSLYLPCAKAVIHISTFLREKCEINWTSLALYFYVTNYSYLFKIILIAAA